MYERNNNVFEKCLLMGTSLIALFYLSGCATTPNTGQALSLLSQPYFPEHAQYQIETPEEIFALNDTVIDFVDQNTAYHYSDKQKLTALVRAIFDNGKLSLNYSSQANFTANQTFEKGSANCLSLTIMVYSMAQYLDLQATFKEINIPEYWTRRQGNTLLNGHINLQVTLQNKFDDYIINTRTITVDFDPMQGNRKFSSRTLTKQQIASYFYTNKAADAMIDENYDRAYAYLKAALNISKSNHGAWLNLGVLFSRNDMIKEAETAYLHASHSKSNSTTAYENLAALYRKSDRSAQAVLIENRISDKRKKNPYYHKMLGDVDFEENNYEKAIRHYKQALQLNHKPHEFYFSLAKAYFALGDIKNTKRYLEGAKRRAKDDDMEQMYESKLSVFASR